MVSTMNLISKSIPMHINLKRAVLVVCVVALCIASVWLLQIVALAKPSPWKISGQSPEFSLISIHKVNAEVRRSSDEEPVFFILRNSSLIFQETVGRVSYKERFNRINLLTGKLESQIIPDQSFSSITNNQETIFITQDTHRIPIYSDQTLKEPGAILVRAFDIDTGDVKWTSVYEGFALTSYMNADENQVQISGNNGHGTNRDQTVLDAFTGEILSGEIDDTFQSDGKLPPYFHIADLGDAIFVLAHNPVIAYDQKTDSIVWQTDIIGSVSNIVVSDGIIYFLDHDAIFHAIDAESGEPLGYVQFEPSNPSKAEPFGDYGATRYTVAADEDNVVLYFSETEQLFFFHFAKGSE